MPPKIRELKSRLNKAGMKRHLYDRYSMVIQWSEEDQAYIVDVPELPGCRTHGETHEEAVKNGLEAIEVWIEAYEALGRPIPKPKVLV